jgi:hypothetical protein
MMCLGLPSAEAADPRKIRIETCEERKEDCNGVSYHIVSFRIPNPQHTVSVTCHDSPWKLNRCVFNDSQGHDCIFI